MSTQTHTTTTTSTSGPAARYPKMPSPSEQQQQQQAEPATQLLPKATQYNLRGGLSNTPLAVSFISAILGGVLCSALTLTVQPVLRQYAGSGSWSWARPQLGVYLACMGLFHLCEFWTTAGWNTQKLSVDAFLLNNGASYWYSHGFGLAEYFISSYFWPSKYESSLASFPFLFAVIVPLLCAQALRSLAMIHASVSFSHIVKAVKHDDHTLVTHGVYAWSRHPSYCGFFYWAVLTQILLGNIVSTLAFVVILGYFFSSRIKEEERFLVRFFGNDYIQYRKRVGTGLPFIVAQA